MKCYECKKECTEKLCNNCKFNDTITMTKTNIKKLFKLSDQDLSKSKPYNFTYIVKKGRYRVDATRYIIDDIENLIEKLSKCSIDDKRYQALQKRRQEKKDEDDRIIKKQNDTKIIKDNLKIMIEKSDKPKLYDYMKHVIDEEIDPYLNIILKQNSSLDVIINHTYNEVERLAVNMNKLYETIKTKYGEEYISIAKTEFKHDYKIAIEHDNPYGLYSYIECYIEDKKKKEMTERIDKLLKNHYKDDNDLKIAKASNIYSKLTGGYDFDADFDTDIDYTEFISMYSDEDIIQQFDKTISEIKHNKELTKTSKIRKNKITKLINEYILEEYFYMIDEHDIYKNYINKNIGDLNQIILDLVEYIDQKLEFQYRLNYLQYFLTSRNYVIEDIMENKICSKFLLNDHYEITDMFDDLVEYHKINPSDKNVQNIIKISQYGTDNLDIIINNFLHNNNEILIIMNGIGYERDYIHKQCQKLNLKHSKISKYEIKIEHKK